MGIQFILRTKQKTLFETMNIIAKNYSLSRDIFNYFKYMFEFFKFAPNFLLNTDLRMKFYRIITVLLQ